MSDLNLDIERFLSKNLESQSLEADIEKFLKRFEQPEAAAPTPAPTSTPPPFKPPTSTIGGKEFMPLGLFAVEKEAVGKVPDVELSDILLAPSRTAGYVLAQPEEVAKKALEPVVRGAELAVGGAYSLPEKIFELTTKAINEAETPAEKQEAYLKAIPLQSLATAFSFARMPLDVSMLLTNAVEKTIKSEGDPRSKLDVLVDNLFEAGKEFTLGAAEVFGKPIGAYGKEEFKKIWRERPGEALVALATMFTPLLRGAAGWWSKPVKPDLLSAPEPAEFKRGTAYSRAVEAAQAEEAARMKLLDEEAAREKKLRSKFDQSVEDVAKKEVTEATKKVRAKKVRPLVEAPPPKEEAPVVKPPKVESKLTAAARAKKDALKVAKEEFKLADDDLTVDLAERLTEQDLEPTTLHPFKDDPRVTFNLRASFEERLKESPRILENPHTYLAYMRNMVNRWVYGEDIPIDKVREGLKSFVANVDTLRTNFPTAAEFNEFAKGAKELYEWSLNEKREPRKTIALYSFPAVDPELFSSIVSKFRSFMKSKSPTSEAIKFGKEAGLAEIKALEQAREATEKRSLELLAKSRTAAGEEKLRLQQEALDAGVEAQLYREALENVSVKKPSDFTELYSGIPLEAFKPEFAKRLVKSVVKDILGLPKMVFHGTGPRNLVDRPPMIERFLNEEDGIHFGSAAAATDRIISTHPFEFGEVPPGTIYPVYLDIRKPIITDLDNGFATARDIVGAVLSAKNLTPLEIDRLVIDIEHSMGDRFSIVDILPPREVIEVLKEKGYDGIVYRNSVEDLGSLSYIVFSNDQIIWPFESFRADVKFSRPTLNEKFKKWSEEGKGKVLSDNSGNFLLFRPLRKEQRFGHWVVSETQPYEVENSFFVKTTNPLKVYPENEGRINRDIIEEYLRGSYDVVDIGPYKGIGPHRALIPGHWIVDDTIATGKLLPAKEAFDSLEVKVTKIDEGVKLYSGFDIVEGVKSLIGLTKSAVKVGKNLYVPKKAPEWYAEFLRKHSEAKEGKPSQRIEAIRRAASRALIDTTGKLKDALIAYTRSVGDPEQGWRSYVLTTISKGAPAVAARHVKVMDSKVYGGLNSVLTSYLNEIIFLMRTVEIDRLHGPGKKAHPGNINGAKAMMLLEFYKNTLGEKTFNLLTNRARRYFEEFRTLLDRLHEEGLVSTEVYNKLDSIDYQTRQWIDLIDPVITYRGFTKSMEVRDSGITRLKRGTPQDILERDGRVIFAEAAARAYGRIFRNKANKALLELAVKYPDNPIVRTKVPKLDKSWESLSMYVGGKRIKIYMRKDYYKEYLLRDAGLTYEMAQSLRVLSGSFILRPFATGINFVFGLAQVPMDMAHIWWTASMIDTKSGKWKSVYSSSPIMALPQMVKDMVTVAPDVFLRRGKVVDMIEAGMGMEFMVHQGSPLKRRLGIRNWTDDVLDTLGYISESCELLTRTALAERALKVIAKREGVTLKEARAKREFLEEAAAVARDYLDFSQGGWFFKAIDNAVPYVNAGVQATRGIFREFKRNKLEAMSKLAWLGAIQVGMMAAVDKTSPFAYGALSESDRRRYFIIPLFGNKRFYDEAAGEEFSVVLAVPKDKSQQLFGMLFDGVYRYLKGEEVTQEFRDEMKKVIGEMLPWEVSALPPTVNAALGYFANFDVYLADKVYKGPPVETKGLEVNPPWSSRASEFAKDIGEQFPSISPERFQFVLDSLFTKNNPYTAAAGWAYNQIMGKVPNITANQHMAITLSENPAVKRFLRVARYSKKLGAKGRLEELSANDERQMNSLKLYSLFQGYENGLVKIDDIVRFVHSVKDPAEMGRLSKMVDEFTGLSIAKNKWLVIQLRAIQNSRVRGKLFRELYDSVDDETKKSYMSSIAVAGGVVTDEFWNGFAEGGGGE